MILLIIAGYLLLGFVTLLVFNILLNKAGISVRNHKDIIKEIELTGRMSLETSIEYTYSIMVTSSIGYLVACLLWPLVVAITYPPILQYLKNNKHE